MVVSDTVRFTLV